MFLTFCEEFVWKRIATVVQSGWVPRETAQTPDSLVITIRTVVKIVTVTLENVCCQADGTSRLEKCVGLLCLSLLFVLHFWHAEELVLRQQNTWILFILKL